MAHILVVDDNPQIRQVLACCLSEFGHAVAAAADGEAALDEVDRHGFDLILLDVDLPRLSGIFVCERVTRHSRKADLPVVMMTGRKTPEVVARSFRAGARAVLDKPFTWDVLKAEVDRQLAASV